jgi:iron(III) transport system substrate-binding protein
MTSVIRRTGAAFTGLALTLAVAGCGGGGSAASSDCQFGPTDDAEWSDTLEQAQEEGTVNFYHVLAPEQGDRLVKAFNEVCGSVEVVQTATGAAMISQVDSQIAQGGNGADVFLWSDTEWWKANADHVQTLDGPYSSEWPQDAWFLPNKTANGLTIPIGFMVWNTEEFPDGFADLSELDDPALKGRFGTREDFTKNYVGYLKWLEETYGEDYVAALGELGPKFYPSTYAIPQAVASGEIGVANTSTSAAVEQLKAQGAPIDYAIGDESYSAPLPIGALSDTANPAAARVFMEFILSEDGQQALADQQYGDSALTVDGELDLTGTHVFDSGAVTPEDVETWETKFDQLMR